MKLPSLFLASVGLLSASSVSAEQTLYRQTDDGWFIYVEERSCVLYADYDDLMVRFSNRVDQDRVYFSIVAERWNHLRPRIGEPAMLMLHFTNLRHGYGAGGLIIRNPDGRMGYSASDFDSEETLRLLATSDGLMVQTLIDGRRETLANLVLTGAGIAVMHLEECTARHFPRADAR